jgi:dipeptidase E
MQRPEICAEIARLAKHRRKSAISDGLKVAYFGTASYDNEDSMTAQCSGLVKYHAATVRPVLLVGRELDKARHDLHSILTWAEVVLVSGGNTLFAVDLWRHVGADIALKDAAQRGLVMCGGSAGAICWFDGGHSDSMDPTTYYGPNKVPEANSTSWEYIRVPGLGLLPGLCCPHYDRKQSNGLWRHADFHEMLKRHPGEHGLGIDHWAALSIHDDQYTVIRCEGVEGQKGPNGVYICDAGAEALTVDASGAASSVLRPAKQLVEDPRCERARRENPIPRQTLPTSAFWHTARRAMVVAVVGISVITLLRHFRQNSANRS